MQPPIAPVPHVCPPAPAPRGRIRRWLERVFAVPLLLFSLLGALFALLGSRLLMPGVIVQTQSRPGPSDLTVAPGATYMVAGVTERGDPVGVVEILSISDYIDKLGDRVSYGALYDDLSVFFAEGGTRALVARIVGPAASVGTLQLVDRAGSPLPTLRIDASSPGAWSTRVKIAVADGAITNSFTITVLYDDVAVETYPNLMTPAAAASAMGTSKYVVCTNLASVTAPPANRPAVLAATALSAGADDRGSLTSGSYTAALARFGPDWGWGAVAIPGQISSAIGQALITHVKTYGRLAIMATAAAQTPSQAKASTVEFLTLTSGAEYAGLFYPWIKIEDGAGGTRTISPEGYVAAARARSNRSAGPWQAAAGPRSAARSIVGVERQLTRAEINDLVDNHVDPVAVISNQVMLYGWRSLSADLRNYRQLTGRDTMNEAAGQGSARLEAYVFGTVDPHGHYFNELEAEMRAVLEPMLTAGGLFEKLNPDGTLLSPAYTINTGPSVNTEEVLAQDQVIVDVGLRTSPTGELIILRLTKVAFDSNAI